MHDGIGAALTPWSNFYVMTGSAAGSLTGLMFVVITLVNRVERETAHDGIATFSTPIVAHFCAALLVSASLSAPWPSLAGPAVLLGVTGLLGVVYILWVMRRTKRLSAYTADLEDWTWFSILPFVGYGAILVGAIVLMVRPAGALFAIAGGVVLLIFIGIRNAWDVVTYITIDAQGKPPSANP